MPARTLNDFFAGFFYGHIRADVEVRVAIARQCDRKKGDRRESHRRDNHHYLLCQEET